jgi:hypothetical protein
VREKPSFFFTVPAKNPRTLCCCQSVACIISSMLAPSGWFSRVSTRSCLVTRSPLESSDVGGIFAAAARVSWDSGERGGFLCLVTHSILGSSGAGDIFTAVTRAGFNPTDRSGFLGLAATDGASRREGASGLAPLFLGAVLSKFRVFLTESAGMVWAPY